MTLHWWMHWFWITRAAVVFTLLLVSPSVAAPPLRQYALPMQQEEQTELHDGSVWPSQHVSSTDIWDLYHFSTTSSTDELSTSSVEWWPTGSSDPNIESVIAEVSASTYLPLETDTTGEVTPIVFARLSDGGQIFSQPITQTSSVSEIVPVQNSTVISNVGSENLNFSEQTPVSIKSVSNISANVVHSSIVTSLKEVNYTKPKPSSDKSSSVDNSKVSLDPVIDTVSSNSQGVDKPMVNVPRLITRDLKNGSHNASSHIPKVASHGSVQENPGAQQLHIASVTQFPPFLPPSAREDKAAGYLSQPLHLHPLLVSTSRPIQVESGSPTHPPNEFLRGVLQSYKPGPKISDDGHVEDVEGSGDSDSRIVWIKPNEASRRKLIAEVKEELIGVGSDPLEDAEMGDSPYNPPESSTVVISKQRAIGETPMPSSEFVLPTDRTVGPTGQEHSSHEKGHKEIPKVTPPLLATTSKAVNTTSHTGRLHENVTRSSYVPPIVSKNSDGNLSVSTATDHANATTVVHETVEKTSISRESSKSASNVTSASNDENETTVDTMEPTVVPISNRVQAPAPPGTHHGLDAASITGISLGILVFATLIGAISFILYRRRFLNKPQTLNDKCSNPDSSGYIDDSTLRENSEEMYSLDNDSFLNSLEAMTIQNYWTDNVKHTKL